MKTRFLWLLVFACAAVIMSSLLCSQAVLTGRPSRVAGPCQLSGPLPFSLDEAHAFQQQFLDTFLTGQTGPFYLDVSTMALNSYVVWQTQGAPLYNLAIWSVPERLCLQGVVGLLGPLQIYLSAAVITGLENGQIHLDIEYAQLGNWVLPSAVRDYLSEITNETVQDAQLRIQFTEFRVADGHLIVAGTRYRSNF
jgi:hypothetical protein